MLTFMNSKLSDDSQIPDKQKHIFQENKSHEISSTDTYVVEDLEFIIRVFSWYIPLDNEIYTKYIYKKYNLIKIISTTMAIIL